MKSTLPLLTACGLAALIASCSTAPLPHEFLRAYPWLVQGINGKAYVTAHYRICTTLRDPQTLSRFARLMEACHAQYEELLPPATAENRPLEIDLLADDHEWRTFTRAITGLASAAYLRVGNGGYAIGDRFVCRAGDEADLFPVAAHEGLHQYIARHFRVRPPPSIEEGLATRFESVSVARDNVTFDFSHNPRRQFALDRARESPIPLNLLLQLHAGDVAGTGETSERYYGQCWALANLLVNDPSYRAGFQRLIDALSRSDVFSAAESREAGTYLPSEVKPLLEKYVAPEWSTFETAYKNCIDRYALTP